jgi:hypothetical protein
MTIEGDIELGTFTWPNPSSAHQMLKASIMLVTIGPYGEAWLDEHAPEWRDHISVLEVSTMQAISDTEMETARDPASLLKSVVSALGHELGRYLAEKIEPRLEREEGHHG